MVGQAQRRPSPGPELEDINEGTQAPRIGMPGITVTWDILNGHVLLTAGCKRGIFHSYQEAMTALIMWAGDTLRDRIEAQIKHQLAPPKEKLVEEKIFDT